ncbi:uncharacterized protein BJ171DRAFT_470985 [Polychytrium aggregatum]|uniref:uncharacterized protein n=1 Tax=Polychytrium aggregatum TaxID=110093 RepID=UPI0022FDF2E9|nr:uncharacterized protein BJ171DRAFT_470985 [Polychytrium aggregatum]KAI9209323.1 hypothetical protein BJ171DRAFT_470985 [Polychytrium aggregatum]
MTLIRQTKTPRLIPMGKRFILVPILVYDHQYADAVPSFDDSENTDNLENLDHPSDSTDDEEIAIQINHPIQKLKRILGISQGYCQVDSHVSIHTFDQSTALGSSDSPEDEIDQISAMLLDIKFEYKVSDAVMKALFRGIGLYSGQIIPKMKSYEHSIAQLEGMSKQNITFFKTCERGCVVHSRTKRTCTACQHRDTSPPQKQPE